MIFLPDLKESRKSEVTGTEIDSGTQNHFNFLIWEPLCNNSPNMSSLFEAFEEFERRSGITSKILDIATDNDPFLKIKAEEVPDYSSPEIQQLIVDMVATMKHAPGIGLAAPQIRRSVRLMVFYLPATRDDVNHSGVPLTVLINPIVTPLCDDTATDYEGCLSVPGMRGKVPRYQRIQYSGLSETGEPISRTAEGWHARLVQHEFDHLNGILYPELMRQEDELITAEQWKAAQEEQKE
jgi:peptide deformylase